MPRSRRFPVTVTHLPITRCQICDRTLAYRPGTIGEAPAEHYRQAIAKLSAPPPRKRSRLSAPGRESTGRPAARGEFAAPSRALVP